MDFAPERIYDDVTATFVLGKIIIGLETTALSSSMDGNNVV